MRSNGTEPERACRLITPGRRVPGVVHRNYWPIQPDAKRSAARHAPAGVVTLPQGGITSGWPLCDGPEGRYRVAALPRWASWKGLAIPCKPRLALQPQAASECTNNYDALH